MPILGDFDPSHDRIEVVLPAGYPAGAIVSFDPDADGSAVLRVDGVAVARVLQAAEVNPADVTLRAQTAA